MNEWNDKLINWLQMIGWNVNESKKICKSAQWIKNIYLCTYPAS